MGQIFIPNTERLFLEVPPDDEPSSRRNTTCLHYTLLHCRGRKTLNILKSKHQFLFARFNGAEEMRIGQTVDFSSGHIIPLLTFDTAMAAGYRERERRNVLHYEVNKRQNSS